MRLRHWFRIEVVEEGRTIHHTSEDYSCSCPPGYEEGSSAGSKHGAMTSPRSYSARRQGTWNYDEKERTAGHVNKQMCGTAGDGSQSHLPVASELLRWEIEGLSSHRTVAAHEAERFLWAVAGG